MFCDEDNQVEALQCGVLPVFMEDFLFIHLFVYLSITSRSTS